MDEALKPYPHVEALWANIKDAIYAQEPSHFGYPSQQTQSGYYPDSPSITEDDVAFVQKLLEDNGLLAENTRIRKSVGLPDASRETLFEVFGCFCDAPE